MSAKARSFEEAMARLEELVTRLEEGDVGLEDSLKAYKEGMELHRFCQDRLRKVEQEVLKVLGEDEDAESSVDLAGGAGDLFPETGEEGDDELPF